MNSIRLMHSVDVPIYKQIVAQLRYMIESGQLADGDRLPSARALADSLDINRHTVARAYGELRDAGMVQSHRTGMIISGADAVRGRAKARQEANQVLTDAIRQCLGFGLSAEEVSNLAVQIVGHLEATRLRVSFVECTAERADYFAKELSDQIGIEVVPRVLSDPDLDDHQDDLLLTTFLHLAEVRQRVRNRGVDVLAIVVAPQVQTLVELAGIPTAKRMGIIYSTEDQAQAMRDALVQSGFQSIENIHYTDGVDLASVDLASIDVVVVPSELAGIGRELEGRAQVVEFGNVLDEASIRMVAAVVAEIAGNPQHEVVSRPLS